VWRNATAADEPRGIRGKGEGMSSVTRPLESACRWLMVSVIDPNVTPPSLLPFFREHDAPSLPPGTGEPLDSSLSSSCRAPHRARFIYA